MSISLEEYQADLAAVQEEISRLLREERQILSRIRYITNLIGSSS